jgi:hypothetical protein
LAYLGERLAIFGMAMGVALLLTGIGFLVLTLGGALRQSEAPAETVSRAELATS